jgi:hypothetical protein
MPAVKRLKKDKIATLPSGKVSRTIDSDSLVTSIKKARSLKDIARSFSVVQTALTSLKTLTRSKAVDQKHSLLKRELLAIKPVDGVLRLMQAVLSDFAGSTRHTKLDHSLRKTLLDHYGILDRALTELSKYAKSKFTSSQLNIAKNVYLAVAAYVDKNSVGWPVFDYDADQGQVMVYLPCNPVSIDGYRPVDFFIVTTLKADGSAFLETWCGTILDRFELRSVGPDVSGLLADKTPEIIADLMLSAGYVPHDLFIKRQMVTQQLPTNSPLKDLLSSCHTGVLHKNFYIQYPRSMNSQLVSLMVDMTALALFLSSARTGRRRTVGRHKFIIEFDLGASSVKDLNNVSGFDLESYLHRLPFITSFLTLPSEVLFKLTHFK